MLWKSFDTGQCKRASFFSWITPFFPNHTKMNKIRKKRKEQHAQSKKIATQKQSWKSWKRCIQITAQLKGASFIAFWWLLIGGYVSTNEWAWAASHPCQVWSSRLIDACLCWYLAFSEGAPSQLSNLQAHEHLLHEKRSFAYPMHIGRSPLMKWDAMKESNP